MITEEEEKYIENLRRSNAVAEYIDYLMVGRPWSNIVSKGELLHSEERQRRRKARWHRLLNAIARGR